MFISSRGREEGKPCSAESGSCGRAKYLCLLLAQSDGIAGEREICLLLLPRGTTRLFGQRTRERLKIHLHLAPEIPQSCPVTIARGRQTAINANYDFAFYSYDMNSEFCIIKIRVECIVAAIRGKTIDQSESKSKVK